VNGTSHTALYDAVQAPGLYQKDLSLPAVWVKRVVLQVLICGRQIVMFGPHVAIWVDSALSECLPDPLVLLGPPRCGEQEALNITAQGILVGQADSKPHLVTSGAPAAHSSSHASRARWCHRAPAGRLAAAFHAVESTCLGAVAGVANKLVICVSGPRPGHNAGIRWICRQVCSKAKTPVEQSRG
jgi:hypothetical protein